MKHTVKSTECNGLIYTQTKGWKSLTIAADLPEFSKIDFIRLIGEVEVNGTKLINPVLEDIDGAVVTYHVDRMDNEIATAYFIDGIPESVLSAVLNYIIQDFEITYTDVCPHCGK